MAVGQLTRSEAAQLWIAAIDHAQATLAVDAYARRAALTGAASDDMKHMKAQGELEKRRRNLQAHIGQHVEADNDSA